MKTTEQGILEKLNEAADLVRKAYAGMSHQESVQYADIAKGLYCKEQCRPVERPTESRVMELERRIAVLEHDLSNLRRT